MVDAVHAKREVEDGTAEPQTPALFTVTPISTSPKSRFGSRVASPRWSKEASGKYFRISQNFSRSDLQLTRTVTMQRLSRLGHVRRTVHSMCGDIELRLYKTSPLFRQLAGNYRSLYQIARSASTPHLLCIPPPSWRKSEDDVSYQDVQAHILLPDVCCTSGGEEWRRWSYRSLRNDGLRVDVLPREGRVFLKVTRRPPPLGGAKEPPSNGHPTLPKLEEEVEVLDSEAVQGSHVVVLWVAVPLLASHTAKRRHRVRCSSNGYDTLHASPLDRTLSGSMRGGSFALNLSVTMLRSFCAEKVSPDRKGGPQHHRRFLVAKAKDCAEIGRLLNFMDEEILIMNTHYFFPPENLSYLTPAKMGSLCEGITEEILSLLPKPMDASTTVGTIPQGASTTFAGTAKSSNNTVTVVGQDGTVATIGGASDSDAAEEEREEIEQAVHSYLLSGVHSRIFHRWLELYQEKEDDFKHICSELLPLSWDHWQIPEKFRGDQTRAVAMCRHLGSLSTPLEMGQGLASITMQIVEDCPVSASGRKETADEASADLLLPLLMRVITLAVGPPDADCPLVTILAFTRDYCCSSMGYSHIAYAAATFEAASEFIGSGACLEICGTG